MVNEAFIQFGMVVLIVLAVSILMRFLKQPLVIGYIISGIIVGPLLLNLVSFSNSLSVLFEISIAFLLFIVGLHLSPRVIKEVGKISFITGIGQMIFTFALGYLIAILFGFTQLTALYIGIALTFSSTIIIMKFLADRDALGKLYGKISIGFLLVQDFVAIFIKIALVLFFIITYAASIGDSSNVAFFEIIRCLALFAVLILFGIYVLPRLSEFFAKSQELLFLFAVAWGVGVSMIFAYIGFSIEIGALIAGVILSMSPYAHEINSKMKPIRDFFVISFFIILGSQIFIADVLNLVWPIIAFSLLILIGSPLIVMVLMGVCGYSKKTSFMTGLTVAQAGEFTLIFIALGVNLGHVPYEVLSLMTLATLVTIFVFTYLFKNSNWIFNKFARLLNVFERKNIKERQVVEKKYDYVLLGYNRIGFSIIKAFAKMKKRFLVVDYNPDIVNNLRKQKLNAIYGDVDDSDYIEDLKLHKSSLVVSTIPDLETSTLVLNILKRKGFEGIIILTARSIKDAFELYNSGADYVILPHFLGGEYASKLIFDAKTDKKVYTREKRKEIEILKKRLKIGHEHPDIERDYK